MTGKYAFKLKMGVPASEDKYGEPHELHDIQNHILAHTGRVQNKDASQGYQQLVMHNRYHYSVKSSA